MSIPVFPLVVAVTGSILIELFFRLVKYKDSPAGGGLYTAHICIKLYISQTICKCGRQTLDTLLSISNFASCHYVYTSCCD